MATWESWDARAELPTPGELLLTKIFSWRYFASGTGSNALRAGSGGGEGKAEPQRAVGTAPLPGQWDGPELPELRDTAGVGCCCVGVGLSAPRGSPPTWDIL